MEHEFHRWLRNEITTHPLPVGWLGMGDDGAILPGSDDDWIITTDGIAEGTHFHLEDCSTEFLNRVGHKLAGVNLSDLAAMGAQPAALTLQFQLPRSFASEQAQALFDGAERLAVAHGARVIGGDTNTWEGPLVLSSTAIGRRSRNVSGWRLDAAAPGDIVLLSGAVGGSQSGRHLDVEPRCELANYLAGRYRIGAATDVSDSLSQDLMAISQASGVGIEIACESIPISDDVAASKGSDAALQAALSDGEDFELLLTMAPEVSDQILADPACPTPLTAIGRVLAAPPGLTQSGGGGLPISGYEH